MNKQEPRLIVGLSYCHKDIDQALRLINWIRWMEDQGGIRYLDSEKLTIVHNRGCLSLPFHDEIVKVATEVFGDVTTIMPETENESGWPWSATHQFRAILKNANSNGEDLLFLEPDAVPMRRDWFKLMRLAWDRRSEGKEFLGALVDHNTTPLHMSGIAIYGRNAIERAPLLMKGGGSGAWDLDARDETLPLAEITESILHKWTGAGSKAKDIEEWLDKTEIPRKTFIFHQDKHGVLIERLGKGAFHYFTPPFHPFKVRINVGTSRWHNRKKGVLGRPIKSEMRPNGRWETYLIETQEQHQVCSTQTYVKVA